MDDKNGKTLQAGNLVKVFTFKRAQVVGFEIRNGEEMAIVSHKDGFSAVYSEEIRLLETTPAPMPAGARNG